MAAPRATARVARGSVHYGRRVRIGMICPYSLSVPGGVQGQVLGLNNACGAFSRFVGPLCAGLAFAHVSHNAPFVMAALVVAPAILLALSAVGRASPSSPRP